MKCKYKKLRGSFIPIILRLLFKMKNSATVAFMAVALRRGTAAAVAETVVKDVDGLIY